MRSAWPTDEVILKNSVSGDSLNYVMDPGNAMSRTEYSTSWYYMQHTCLLKSKVRVSTWRRIWSFLYISLPVSLSWFLSCEPQNEMMIYITSPNLFCLLFFFCINRVLLIYKVIIDKFHYKLFVWSEFIELSTNSKDRWRL